MLRDAEPGGAGAFHPKTGFQPLLNRIHPSVCPHASLTVAVLVAENLSLRPNMRLDAGLLRFSIVRHEPE